MNLSRSGIETSYKAKDEDERQPMANWRRSYALGVLGGYP